MGGIDLDLQGHLATSIHKTASNVTLVHWSRPAKGCYTPKTCSFCQINLGIFPILIYIYMYIVFIRTRSVQFNGCNTMWGAVQKKNQTWKLCYIHHTTLWDVHRSRGIVRKTPHTPHPHTHFFIIRAWPFFIWWYQFLQLVMKTSSNGIIFCITGPLCGEFTGHMWIPPTKASNTEMFPFDDVIIYFTGGHCCDH